jgi:hypothetical protein
MAHDRIDLGKAERIIETDPYEIQNKCPNLS